MKITGIIKRQIVSEKSLLEEERGKYVFEVIKASTSGAVKQEIKKLYGVDVVKVRTIILPGKPKRMGRSNLFKKTAQRKKVIVELKKGQKIDFSKKDSKKK